MFSLNLLSPLCLQILHNRLSIFLVFFQESTAKEIISHFEGEHADLVVCDGAPDGKTLIY